MKRIIIYILLLSIFPSCFDNQDSNDNSIYYDEFYSILNGLIQYQLEDVSSITYKTMPVFSTGWGNKKVADKEKLYPPPPGVVSYDLNSVKYFSKQNLLDSIDAIQMYNTLDSTRVFNIDSSKVIIPVISKEQYETIFNNNDLDKCYDLIKDKYGSRCFISVSSPIFNSDYSKVIIFIDYQCGPLWGQGYRFLLEKKKGYWKTINISGTWES